MVSRKGHPWVKDSIDFLAFIFNEDTDSVELCGVEIKCRVKHSTVFEEKEYNRKTRGTSKYIMADAHDAHKFIHKGSDRWQILHHAYVYGLDRVAYVIGSNAGKVISGTIVKFDKFSELENGEKKLSDCYEKVLDEIKDLALFYAYDGTNAAFIKLPNEVEKMADEVRTINSKISNFGRSCLMTFPFYPVLPSNVLSHPPTQNGMHPKVAPTQSQR